MNYFNYYTEIEDLFVRRRGRHLILSPLDWALMTTWKEMGVPLHVVLRGVEKSFDSYESRPRKRSVKSLFYCQEEVEAQYAEWLEMQRGASSSAAGGVSDAGGETGVSGGGEAEEGLPFPRAAIAAHLSEGRESLVAAARARRERAGEDELSEALTRAAARLEELETDFQRGARPDAERLEASLTDLERLLDCAARAHTNPAALASIRAQAEGQLKPYRTRMERPVYEQTLENLEAKALREHHRLPRLSLFYL